MTATKPAQVWFGVDEYDPEKNYESPVKLQHKGAAAIPVRFAVVRWTADYETGNRRVRMRKMAFCEFEADAEAIKCLLEKDAMEKGTLKEAS